MDRNKMNITLQPSQYISTSAVILQLLIREWKLDSVTRSQYLEHHQRRSVVEEKDERGAEVFGGPSSELKSACNSALMKLVVFDVDIGDGEPIHKFPYNRLGNLCYFVSHFIVWFLQAYLLIH